MDQPLTIAVLPLEGFALMAFASAVEPLRAANLLGGREVFRLHFLTLDGKPAVSSVGAVVPSLALNQAPKVDLVLVVAGGAPMTAEIADLAPWLRRQAARGVMLGGVSGGPVILARAGLMENRRMTVHWEHAAELSQAYPGLLIERSLYVVDRDRITCAGGTAPLDMMHALIAERAGPEIARRVADWYMHTEIRASADPQRAEVTERYRHVDRRLALAIESMENHIADPLDHTQLALLAGISKRHLNRLFQQQLGEQTMGFYRRLRLETAARLLSRSTLRIGEIAEATGFVSRAHFNHAFAEHFDQTPARWRIEDNKVLGDWR